MAIGETSALDGGDKEKIQDLATRVKDLNARLNDIRREQVFQRVSFALFLTATLNSCILSSPTYAVDRLGRMLITICEYIRNARPNFAISLRALTRAWSVGF